MQRINRKIKYIKYFSFPFHLITVSEGGNLAPVACWGCLNFVQAPQWNWELCWHSLVAAASCHRVTCMRGIERSSGEDSRGSMSVPGMKEDIWQLEHRSWEILDWLCLMQSTLKGLAHSWWCLYCGLRTPDLGENPVLLLRFQNARWLPWELLWIATGVIISNGCPT